MSNLSKQTINVCSAHQHPDPDCPRCNVPLSSKKESPLRRYFRFRPVIVEGEPEAQRIEFHVGNQTFGFGPEYCESVEHAEWFIAMGIKALHNAFRGLCNKCNGHGYVDEGDSDSGPYLVECDECGGKGKLSTDESQVETSDALLSELYYAVEPDSLPEELERRVRIKIGADKPSAQETTERPLTLGKLIVNTARGDVKERTLSAEEAQQVRNGIAQKASALPPGSCTRCGDTGFLRIDGRTENCPTCNK